MSFPVLRLAGLVAVLLLSVSACTPVGVAVGAAATVGAAAADERGIRGSAEDARIAAEINHYWFQHDHVLYGQLGLQVNEGRALVTGVVPSPEARVDAVRLAWQAQGVREVLNEIQVTSETTIDKGRDVWIANQLRGRLMFDSAIRNINFSVDVVNGIVYLIGIAQNQEEMDRVAGHARNLEHVRRVVNYIILRDDPRRRPQS